jgi:poly(beta-D-mannuronate) lyase
MFNSNWLKPAVGFLAACASTVVMADTILIEKNGFDFSVDGAGGASSGRVVYLWGTNLTNINQHWVTTEIDSRFVQLRKAETDFCIDGGSGGSEGQSVVLQVCDDADRDQHWEFITLSNGTTRIKKRGVSFSIDSGPGAVLRQELFLSRSQDSNVNQQWNIQTLSSDGDGGGDGNGSGVFGLNPNAEPWENFDLSDWVIDTPAFASDGDSERFGELDWDEISDESRAFFFTHTDGGMRFVTRLDGARTSTNTSFVRSELREMLRAGNDDISTTGVNGNNWRLGYQPGDADDWGGTNGVLSATLRVNKVTTTGNGIHVGRTIIGQIHADNDEPARLYYRKEPGDARGCIYLSHEIRDEDDVDFDIIGNEDCDNPSNGIELDEMFSYQIINDGADIDIIIRRGDRDGPIIGTTTVDMDELDSGYDRDDEWMYFKLGAYTQNNRGDDSDGDIITFYRISNTHD